MTGAAYLRALAAQARGVLGDRTLVGVCTGALLLSISLATRVPAHVADAPPEVKTLLAEQLSTVVAVYGALMAAIYGSFRYTVDRRRGVVAQRATLQPRAPGVVARVPFTAVGGVAVAAVALLGARVALAPALGTTGLHEGPVAGTLVVGAGAALWGLGVGLLVQAHLVALFVAPLSLSVALFLGIPWPEPATWMPLPTLLHATGFDLAAVGLGSAASGTVPDPAAARVLALVWTGGGLLAGIASFLRRDIA